MPITYDSVRIVNALVTAALAGTYYRKVWNSTTKLVSVDQSVSITPTGVVADEIRSAFVPSPTQRRTRMFERKTWLFLLQLEFEVGVTTEQFEGLCLSSPIRLNRDPANGQAQGDRSITLVLVTADYKHPAHNSSGGSHVALTFEAQLTPL